MGQKVKVTLSENVMILVIFILVCLASDTGGYFFYLGGSKFYL